MNDGVPRHLADPLPLRRRRGLWTGVGLSLLLVLAAVVWVGSSSGPEGDANGRQASQSVAARQAGGAGATTTVASATTAQAAGDGPRNLLANASFEGGSQGWSPIGGARLTRSTEATSGDWSLRILAESPNGGPVGITVPNVTVTKANGRYHTNAWVKPSAPGATVTIGLRELRDGRAVPGSNTLGWTVERAGWRQFGAIHSADQAGSRLTLEIMARDLPPGGYLDVDEVVLHLLGNR